MKDKIGSFFFKLCLLAAAAAFLFPIFWTFTMSFKERTDIFTNTPPLFPHTWTLQNFREVFGTSGAFTFFKNSFFVSLCTTVLVVLFFCHMRLRPPAAFRKKQRTVIRSHPDASNDSGYGNDHPLLSAL